MQYTTENILRIAKRYNNAKRSYLLVNPLQAKHISVSPEKALDMMDSLGNMLYEKYPYTKLVIGFAETATAIGAEVSSCFDEDCNYIHTTREDISDFISFSEEHSHAVEQKLYSAKLTEFLSDTPSVIFIDDEISTGKTLINIINSLRKKFPELNQKEIICASIINRVSEENMQNLKNAKIKCEYLLKLPEEDYESKVKNIRVSESIKLIDTPVCSCPVINVSPLPDPRKGVNISDYYGSCIKSAKKVFHEVFMNYKLDKISGDILILGTEEFMYPALICAEWIRCIFKKHTYCHATTRSPIGICREKNYPIQEGYKIPSFYDVHRETYIYNLRHYDCVIIFTDSRNIHQKSVNAVITALKKHDCEKIFIVKGESIDENLIPYDRCENVIKGYYWISRPTSDRRT